MPKTANDVGSSEQQPGFGLVFAHRQGGRYFGTRFGIGRGHPDRRR